MRRFVRPLREAACRADLTWRRFETGPGQQSQIDWGQARVVFGTQLVVRHIFVLTLGFSRRSVYVPYLDEALGSFLDAHETAFEYFGGHTQEHLYDRARTVCHPLTEGGSRWNATFKAFAAYWSFEPRLCQPYRAQTKGKVESGVKYFRRNFLPGRTFRDDTDFQEQLAAWTAKVWRIVSFSKRVVLLGTPRVRPFPHGADEDLLQTKEGRAQPRNREDADDERRDHHDREHGNRNASEKPLERGGQHPARTGSRAMQVFGQPKPSPKCSATARGTTWNDHRQRSA